MRPRFIGAYQTPWTAPDGSRWHVTTAWAQIRGRAECVGITVRAYRAKHGDVWGAVRHGSELKPIGGGGQAMRPVDSLTLRAIPVGSIVEDVRQRFASTLESIGTADARRDVTALRRRSLKGLSSEDAAASVAAVYRAAWIAGRPPTQAVAERFGLTPGAAAKRVARARQKGFLPKTAQGRPKGGQDGER